VSTTGPGTTSSGNDVYSGCARGEIGEDAIAEIQPALAGRLSMGSDSSYPFFLTQLARCFAKAGRVEEGLEALTEALTRIERTSERWWEAEAHRLMGELLLQRSPTGFGQAEGCYRRAVERARGQGAKSLELRASTSLAELWRDQGKHAEARDLLAPIYGWFTEGFDTADLKDARALLEELQ
jgi:predicted ATPase